MFVWLGLQYVLESFLFLYPLSFELPFYKFHWTNRETNVKGNLWILSCGFIITHALTHKLDTHSFTHVQTRHKYGRYTRETSNNVYVSLKRCRGKLKRNHTFLIPSLPLWWVIPGPKPLARALAAIEVDCDGKWLGPNLDRTPKVFQKCSRLAKLVRDNSFMTQGTQLKSETVSNRAIELSPKSIILCIYYQIECSTSD